MYGLIVEIDPTRGTPVSGGRKERLNFGNVAVIPRTVGGGDQGSWGDIGRKLECWRCEGEHMKRDCLKRAKEKEKKMMAKTSTINVLR